MEQFEASVPEEGLQIDWTKTKKKAFSKVGWAMFIMVFVGQVGAVIITLAANAINPNLFTNSWFLWLAGQVPTYLVALPIMLLVLKPVPLITPQEGHKPTIAGMLKLALVAYALMYIFNILTLLINAVIGLIKGSPVLNPLESMVGDVWSSLVCTVIIAPVMEEFVFRRVIMGRLLPYGETFAAVTSGLIFALMHGNLSQLFYAFALGVFFGFVAIRTGSIKYTIVLHVVVNAVGILVMPGLITLGNTGIMIAGGLILLFLIGGITVMVRERRQFYAVPAPDGSKVGQNLKLFLLSTGGIAYLLICMGLILIATLI